MVYVSPNTNKRYLNGVRYSEAAHSVLSNPSENSERAFALRCIDGEWNLVELAPTFTDLESIN